MKEFCIKKKKIEEGDKKREITQLEFAKILTVGWIPHPFQYQPWDGKIAHFLRPSVWQAQKVLLLNECLDNLHDGDCNCLSETQQST